MARGADRPWCEEGLCVSEAWIAQGEVWRGCGIEYCPERPFDETSIKEVQAVHDCFVSTQQLAEEEERECTEAESEFCHSFLP